MGRTLQANQIADAIVAVPGQVIEISITNDGANGIDPNHDRNLPPPDYSLGSPPPEAGATVPACC